MSVSGLYLDRQPHPKGLETVASLSSILLGPPSAIHVQTVYVLDTFRPTIDTDLRKGSLNSWMREDGQRLGQAANSRSANLAD